MNEFDLKAAKWVDNPMHWDRSEAIAKEIIHQFTISWRLPGYC
jgi:hypothetical protein